MDRGSFDVKRGVGIVWQVDIRVRGFAHFKMSSRIQCIDIVVFIVSQLPFHTMSLPES